MVLRLPVHPRGGPGGPGRLGQSSRTLPVGEGDFFVGRASRAQVARVAVSPPRSCRIAAPLQHGAEGAVGRGQRAVQVQGLANGANGLLVFVQPEKERSLQVVQFGSQGVSVYGVGAFSHGTSQVKVGQGADAQCAGVGVLGQRRCPFQGPVIIAPGEGGARLGQGIGGQGGRKPGDICPIV